MAIRSTSTSNITLGLRRRVILLASGEPKSSCYPHTRATIVYFYKKVLTNGSQSIRTQVNSYSFWSIRTQNFGQLVLIWSIRTHVWSVRTHFGQFVSILVNSYSNANEYELTVMSTN